MGYCPFESRYNGLYRDTGQLGVAAGATTRPVSAIIWQRTRPATRARGPREALRHCRPAREGLAAGGLCHDTNGCIVMGGRLGRCVVLRDRLRYGRGHGHDTALSPCCALGLGSVRVQWARNLGSRCAPCAPNPILTQETVWDTIHEHCS